MRFIRPTEVEELRRVSPLTWTGTGDEDGAFVFDIPPGSPPFVCFFLRADAEHAAPKVAFDVGHGFDDLTAIAFRAFPFGFYHVSLARIGAVRRLRFRACEGRTTFRCLVFQTARPVFVAVLHYLFNLRYQKIGLVAPATGGKRGARAFVSSNLARIRTFFTTVSDGGGVRVQQADDDVLERLRLWQALQAKPVQDAMRARLAPGAGAPLISFVSPVYNTQPDYLRDLLASFVAQDAPYAELILADDGSTNPATRAALAAAGTIPGVRVLALARNGGIAVATNAGVAAARGPWVAFIDHDDAFASGAVAVIARAIIDHPDADFFYTDEIITNAALKSVGSFCKPAYDSVLLSGSNYINHFSIFRRANLEAIGGLALDCEGSQDYDLLLRYLAGARTGAVVHIPFLAYVWRRGDDSYSAVFRERSIANARRALQRAYAGDGVRSAGVTVEPALNPELHRIRFVAARRPAVSVVIPNRDSLALVTRVVDDLRTRTDYPDLEIVIPDNGSTDRRVLDFYERCQGNRFRVERIEEPFNFSRMCNRGARLAQADVLLFLNNDIEVIEPGWLAEMVECLSFAATGIVGAKLLYPTGRIQHAGVIVGLGEAAGHWYVDDAADVPGPMGRLAVRQTIGAVTGACMLVTRACYDTVGGFDEAAFPIAYNDVDLCIRAKAVGFRTVWTPFATLYHHESATRGTDKEGESNIRFRSEFARLQDRHGTKTLIDEAYSPFYDRRYSQPHLTLPTDLPIPRRNMLS